MNNDIETMRGMKWQYPVNYGKEIESEVDTDVTGCYEVIYTFEDTVNGTGTAAERLYVVVTEGGTD